MRLAREKPRGFQVLGSHRRFHGKLIWSPQGDDSLRSLETEVWYSLSHYGIAPINGRKRKWVAGVVSPLLMKL